MKALLAAAMSSLPVSACGNAPQPSPAASAAAPAREWAGKGTREYVLDREDMRLVVACSTREDSVLPYASIVLIRDDGAEVPAFAFSVDGNSHGGPFHAGNQSGIDEFIAILGGLHDSGMDVAFEGRRLAFPSRDAGEAIPRFGSRDFPCSFMGA